VPFLVTLDTSAIRWMDLAVRPCRAADRCRSLDAIVAELGLPRVDVLKIDTDGGELDVLAGARTTLGRSHPKIIMEFSAHCLMNFARVNPPDAYEQIRAMFPSVQRITSQGELEDPGPTYHFMLQHVLHRGCVDNLLCSYDAIV
jgi:hypothetical protein